VLGVGYSLLGIAFIWYGHRRQFLVEAAVVILAAATIAVILLAGS
jgi:hypothetical protein